MHADPHPFAGRTVLINIHPEIPLITLDGPLSGVMEFRVEDWADRVLGFDLMSEPLDRYITSNYVSRAIGSYGLGREQWHTPDTELIYGKVGPLSHIIHVRELHEE